MFLTKLLCVLLVKSLQVSLKEFIRDLNKELDKIQ